MYIIKERDTLEIVYFISWISEFSKDLAESLIVETGFRYFAVRIRKEKNLELLSIFVYSFRDLTKKITLDILHEISFRKILEIIDDNNCDFVDILKLIKNISYIDLSFAEDLTNFASESVEEGLSFRVGEPIILILSLLLSNLYSNLTRSIFSFFSFFF